MVLCLPIDGFLHGTQHSPRAIGGRCCYAERLVYERQNSNVFATWRCRDPDPALKSAAHILIQPPSKSIDRPSALAQAKRGQVVQHRRKIS